MHVIIDLINGDDVIVTTKKEKISEVEEKEIKLNDRKIIQKQVININGEIVPV